MNLKAVIFDLDGTVLDNEAVYGKAFRKVLTEQGGRNLPSGNPQVSGIGIEANWKLLLSKYKLDSSLKIEELIDKTQKYYRELFSEVKVRPGFRELVQDLQSKEVKLALATSNTKDVTEEIISYFQLGEFF